MTIKKKKEFIQAAVTGKTEVVQALLERKKKLEQGNSANKEPESDDSYIPNQEDVDDALSKASTYGKFKMVKLLVEEGNGRAYNGAVQNACTGHTDSAKLVRFLLNSSEKCLETLEGRGIQNMAAACAKLNVTKCLVNEFGVDPSSVINDTLGGTHRWHRLSPVFCDLHSGEEVQRLALVKFLLRKGANTNTKCSQTGESPLHAAFSRSSTALSQYIRELLARDIDVNSSDKRGQTPLMRCVASSSLNAKVVEPLLKKGADASAVDEDGNSVLMLLRGRGFHRHSSLVRRLVSAGCNANHINNAGLTVLMQKCNWDGLVAASLSKSPLEVLASLDGFNVNLRNQEDNTALMVACSRTGVAGVGMLVSHGAHDQHDYKNSVNGDNALILLVKRFEDQTFELFRKEIVHIVGHLLERKVTSVNHRNKDGNTALKLALASKWEEKQDLVRLLTPHGAHVTDQMILDVGRRSGTIQAHTKLNKNVIRCLVVANIERDGGSWFSLNRAVAAVNKKKRKKKQGPSAELQRKKTKREPHKVLQPSSGGDRI